MKKDTKQRLFEMMGKIDSSFKPRLNENAFNDDGEPMMTHNQYRDYSEPSEPDFDDNMPERELSGKELVKMIEKHFDTILETYDGTEYNFLTKGADGDLMLYFGKNNTVSAYGVDGKVFPETNIEDLNVDELIDFIEQYRQYIISGEEAVKSMDWISQQNNADRHYDQQERGMMGGG